VRGALWLLQDERVSERPRRHLGQACAALVLLLGALTFSEYVLGMDFGIDELLFADSPFSPVTSSPGRMGPNTALCFLLIGLALLLLDAGAHPGTRQLRRPPFS